MRSPDRGRAPSRSLIPFQPSIPNRSDGKLPPEPKKKSRFELPPHLRPFVIAGGTIAMVAVSALVAWGFSDAVPTHSRGGVPVVLNVEANLPVQVRVRHRPSEERSARDEVQLLGESPAVHALRGVHVGDTVILENPVQGAYYEETIEFGQPNEVVILRKEFQTGHVQFRLSRVAASGLGVYRNAHQLAPYVADVKIALVEGPHNLEIRGARLKRPVKVQVVVRGGQVTHVDAPALVLRDE